MAVYAKTFCVKNSKIPRVLFHIKWEGEDLQILLKNARYLHNEEDGIVIKDQKFSIHPSNRSKKINSLKHTLLTEKNEEITNAYNVPCIKSDMGFNFVFAKVCNNLEEEVYNFDDSKCEQHEILIGPTYSQSDKATFCYAVLLGKAGNYFDIGENKFLQCHQEDYGDYRIIVLCTRFPTPSLTNGRIQPLKDMPETLNKALTVEECIEFFDSCIVTMSVIVFILNVEAANKHRKVPIEYDQNTISLFLMAYRVLRGMPPKPLPSDPPQGTILSNTLSMGAG